ncbi:uncharacterized protein MONOS_18701 [Monocercomonoides exilis]|uniref:uncharacterized protein n=1 Tax=Monocercomonoides exilis TaxID=2049356 RepID=UPI00355A9124|nr:hypothetical protein MONOS_18701 [Monocercomonoides exilis]
MTQSGKGGSLITSVLFVLSLLQYLYASIYVQPDTGNNNTDCLQKGIQFPCKTLHNAVNNAEANTEIIFTANISY